MRGGSEDLLVDLGVQPESRIGYLVENGPFSGVTMIDILSSDTQRKPNSQVFTFVSNDGNTDDEVSYSELEKLITKVSAAIDAVKTDQQQDQDKVVILLPPGKSFVACFYACLASGVIAVPSFPPQNELHIERLKLTLDDLQSPIVIGDDKSISYVRNDLPEYYNYRCLLIDDCYTEKSQSLSSFKTSPKDIAMLQYSSGSTGKPKGVMITNGNLVANSKLINECFGHKEGKSRAAIWLPPYHDMGMVGGVLQGVYSSYPTMLIPTNVFLSKQLKWLECVSRFGATSSGGPNFAYQFCVKNIKEEQLKHIDLSSWEIAFCGAEPIRYETMNAFSNKFKVAGFNPKAIYPCYGMAEATLMVSGKKLNEPMHTIDVDSKLLAKNIVRRVSDLSSTGIKTLVSSGVAHKSIEVKVVDPMLQIEKTEGEIGEIWISGSSVAAGYWNDPEKTQLVFHKKLLGCKGDFHRTGDTGFIMDGEIYITGRIKEVIIIRGENYYPQDIEHEVNFVCDLFKNCRSAAFSIEKNDEEILVVAIEVPKSSEDFDGLQKIINERLIDKFGVKASQVIILPRKTIKLTSSGKIQRTALKERYLNGDLQSYHVVGDQIKEANVNEPVFIFDASSEESVLSWLRYVIAKKLKIRSDDVLPNDQFSGLGLDSVEAIDVLVELENTQGVCVEPEVLYEVNTPLLLAKEIYKLISKI